MELDVIIFDLDGTAMPSAEKSMPSAELIKVTNQFKKNIHLCAATGRSWPLAKDIIKSLGLIDPCITSGGSVIVDPSNEEILWQRVITRSSMESIVEIANVYNYPVAYVSGLNITFCENIATTPESVNIFYIFDVPAEKVAGIVNKLEEVDNITVSKAYSWNVVGGMDLHITNQEATKEHAVFKLCSRLNIDASKSAGVGDGFNDLHLFNAVGYKVAMGNAVQELKDQADVVIDSLDKEGLATFIKSSVRVA
jgi:HAD superfamily hydrolase (TIGR01484 family)